MLNAVSMSHCAEPRRFVAFRGLSFLCLTLLAVAPGRVARAQLPPVNPQDEIGLAGPQTLTLGSGARAFGMGGAFLSRADDATAAAWNPAGLSYLRLPELSAVGNYNVFDATFGNDRDDLRGGAIDFASFAWPIRIGGASGSIQVNYQRAVPWDGDRTQEQGHPLGTRVFTSDQNGGFDIIAFGAGLKVTRKLRVGATLNRWFNGYTVEQEKVVPGVPRGRRLLAQEFDLSGWNSNLGLIYSPVEQVNVAGVFKTPFTADVNLRKARTDIFLFSSGEVDRITANEYESDDVTVDFPYAFGFGVSWRPRSTLTASADYTKTNWSESRIHNYFTLDPSQPDQEPPSPVVYPELLYPYVTQDAQNDTEEIRVGFEYVFIRNGLKVPLRGGYFNTKRINVEQTVEDPPRFNGFTLGIGLLLGPVLCDVAYLYEWGEVVPEQMPESRAAPITVRNTVKNQRLFASFIYRFGAP
jgi:long-subunit fatty acid transport protein